MNLHVDTTNVSVFVSQSCDPIGHVTNGSFFPCHGDQLNVINQHMYTRVAGFNADPNNPWQVFVAIPAPLVRP